jgi:hypothetical protein
MSSTKVIQNPYISSVKLLCIPVLPVHAIHNYIHLCTTGPSVSDWLFDRKKERNMCTKCCISIPFTPINIHSYIIISTVLLNRNVLDLCLYWVLNTENFNFANTCWLQTQFTKREQTNFVMMQRASGVWLSNAGMSNDYHNMKKCNLPFLHLCYAIISWTILSSFSYQI